jgi:DNA helicase-2/ATP-dependent DNA helicase PcrA
MDMSINQIKSSSLLSDIEHHFRVSAGPGAGKTHWLVHHIKNVLHQSNRLHKTRKIACITYTNIAVKTILERLGTASTQVEVATIHSFLYKNVVKPYASFVAEEYGLNVAKMDGHDEYIISKSKMNEWIKNHPQASSFSHPYTIEQLTKRPENQKALKNWLESLSYKFLDNNELEMFCNKSEAFYMNNDARQHLGASCLNKLEKDFLSFKKLYWQEGTLHHSDVLFFSYQIIKKHPFVLEVLRTKFPYFFVDEFQDSHPIQVAILKKIGEKETIVGIIGDKAQAIYGFQGADYAQFMGFSLPNLKEYAISENRRSTKNIIDVLNVVRTDIIQTTSQDNLSEKPIIFVGNKNKALDNAQKICGEEPVHSLSRQHITVNSMKKELEDIDLKDDIFDNLKECDTPARSRIMIASIKVIELAREKKFKDAIKEFVKIVEPKTKKEERKRNALKFIQLFLQDYDEFQKGTLLDYCKKVTFFFDKLEIKVPSFKQGKAKNFYETHIYKTLSSCVKTDEETSYHRTIHKSKGDEFDNVLLVLKEEKDLAFLTKPNLNTSTSASEEHRIHYVAASRAKSRLFISTPTMTKHDKNNFLDDKFNIIDV